MLNNGFKIPNTIHLTFRNAQSEAKKLQIDWKTEKTAKTVGWLVSIVS